MKVSLVYNLKKNTEIEHLPADYYSEFDSLETIESIAEAIRSNGHNTSLIEADNSFIGKLLREKPDMVFNIAEGENVPNRESHIPAILDYLGIPYTGSGVLSLALSLDKAMAKRIFLQQKIPTPKFQVFDDKDAALKRNLVFPLIVKPNCEGSAKGITNESVVYNKTRLYEEVGKVLSIYGQQALVEEFIDGRELTVGVIGNNHKFKDLPVLEIDFSSCRNSGEYFYSWRMKEYQGNEEMGLTPQFYCPAELDDKLVKRVKDVACKAHSSLNCNDISRVDIRLSRDNVPYVLEVNPLPGLDPKESNFPLIAKVGGIDYSRLIGLIIELALSRYDSGFIKQGLYPDHTTMTYSQVISDSALNQAKGGEDVIER